MVAYHGHLFARQGISVDSQSIVDESGHRGRLGYSRDPRIRLLPGDKLFQVIDIFLERRKLLSRPALLFTQVIGQRA